MRASLPTLLLILVALQLPACQSCPQAAQALVERPNFDSAEKCAKSFFAALSIDDAQAEYKCFARDIKRKYGATFDAYLLSRPQLDEQLGSTRRYAFNLEVLSTTLMANGATLIWWGHNGKRIIGTACVAQHYFSVETTEGQYGSLLEVAPRNFLTVDGKRMIIDLNNPIIRSLPNTESISAFEIASEWKIADFIQPPQP
ncbi:MAG: hypothetical protein H8E25_18060 [Planctomycetes bacterium]|nr:hypothetical protein [Planctomycetota bacterium]